MRVYSRLGAAFAALLFLVCKSSAQHECSVALQDLVFVDTISIESPVVLRFDHLRFSSYQETNVLLVPLCMLDSLKHSNDRDGFFACLKSGAFLFVPPYEAYIVVDNLLYRSPHIREADVYRHLRTRLASMEKDQVYRYYYSKTASPKYYEIISKKFLYFLIRLEAYNRLQTDGGILVVGNPNEYLRMLVPITR